MNKRTYRNSPFVEVSDFSQGNFRGPKGFIFKNLPKGFRYTGGMDGVGTKVVLIVANGRLQSAASDVVAMTAMDITRWGGLPLLFMNIFDVRTLGKIGSETYKMCLDVMDGLQNIMYHNQYVSFTGETAELGLCVGSENPDAKLMFNWGGCMLGVYHPEKMILGNTLKAGQIVIVLRDWFRSNGISSVRKALAMEYTEAWFHNPKAFCDIEACAIPSILYDRFLNNVHGWFEKKYKPLVPMHSIVHLSGGAFKSKFGDDILAKNNLSAVLDNLFEPPEIMQKCANWRGMSKEECYETWNGGQGALVVVDEDRVSDFLSLTKETSIQARVAGEITKKAKYNVAIKSKFDKGGWIYY
jgi:phosphoribosylaminoimidazole (AIR) synthetase